MDHQVELILGMMSGTSMDGIDVVIVEFSDITNFKVLASSFTPFSDELRTKISATVLNNSTLTRAEDSPLHDQLATHYARAALELIDKSTIKKQNISAIANHGQTVKHEPNATLPYSLQLGNGQLIADQTSITTITQFRQADLAVGGQGAPLMPAFHNAVFNRSDDTYILNLGGIANITCLGENVIGFDTGPSNCLIDQWINKHHDQRFDKNGEWAASGNIIKSVLSKLLDDPYLHKPYPKSTGTDYYNLVWLESLIPDLNSYEPKDIQTTLTIFTVKTIELALTQLNAHRGEIFICGGGALNIFLIELLEQTLTNFSIKKTDVLGVPSDLVEATGFAWLGYCHLRNIPSNLPAVTGASKNLVLGHKYSPTPNYKLFDLQCFQINSSRCRP